MKGIKKGLSLVLALMLILSLFTGCNGESKDKEGKFVIGGFGPITGDAASYGTSVMNSSKIAIDEINKFTNECQSILYAKKVISLSDKDTLFIKDWTKE